MRLSMVIIALSLMGCASYDGTQTAEIGSSAEMIDSIPTGLNDGHYDGGVFDQNLVNPLRPGD
jgi:hypothetical protein